MINDDYYGYDVSAELEAYDSIDKYESDVSSGCNPGYDVSAELEAYDSIESYVLSECNPGYDVSAELEAYDSIESYENDAPELSYMSAVEGLK